jgi:hypothetical protein
MNIEVQHHPGGMLDSDRIALGKEIAEILLSREYEEGENSIVEELESRGFDRVEYYNVEHDILLIGLWKFDGTRLTDEFFLEFSGVDAMYLTLLCADEPGHQVEL